MNVRRWLAGLLGVTVLVVASSGAAVAAPSGGDGGSRLTGGSGGGGLSYRDTIEFSLEDIEAFWSVTLPEVFGVEYEPVSEIIPYDSNTDSDDFSACNASGTFEVNASYCPVDDTVSYDDEQLFPFLYEKLGNFAIAMTLAHEWGHAIQARVVPDALIPGVVPSVFVELQADCYAGAWAAWVDSGQSDRLVLEPGDLEVGISGMLTIRDEVGTDPADESELAPHGSGFDRVSAFQEGIEQGAARCAQYFESPPSVVELPYFDEVDLANEGDLPYADTVDFYTQDLEFHWAWIFEGSGLEYDGISDVQSYNPKKKGTLPECEALDLAPNRPRDYRGGVFYCPGDEFIAYDNSFLKRVHRDYGDFAAGLLLGDAWARGMQDDLAVEGDPAAVGLQADCFGGFWVGTIPVQIDDNGDGVYNDVSAQGDPVPRESAGALSPGDLDEIVIGFTKFSDPTAAAGSGFSAFDRVQAFRTGFFAQSLDECSAYAG